MKSLGIDVAVRRGLDLVLLDDSLVPLETVRRVAVDALADSIRSLGPDVVAIDSPPAWGNGHCGGARCTEREIRQFGIQCFGTPTRERAGENPFYAWMKEGFRAFGQAERAGFPRYRTGSVRGTAIEVFPHASAVVLAGCLPPASVRKREWRAHVLRSQGVKVKGLRSADQVDAALAGLTGLVALRGRCFAPGDPKEGVIVLPARSLPPPPYRRCAEPPRPEPLHLPGLSPCRCGDPSCDRLTSGEFAPGHDAKRKSMLWKLSRQGQGATDELRRRGWEMPPEMR